MKSYFLHFFYFGFFSWLCITGPFNPMANYDMLPYVGATLSYTEKNINLRERSLAEVKKYVSSKQYNNFIGGSYYTETVANEDKAFAEQLPGYRVKPFYILLTGLLGKAIDNMPLAAVIISSLGFFLMGIALYLLRPQGSKTVESIWLISIPLILHAGYPTLILLPKAASPDSLAAGLLLMGFWVFLKNPRSFRSTILFCLAILTRPDSIITVACLFPLLFKIFNEYVLNLSRLVAALTMPVITYLFIKVFFPSFGIMELIIFASQGPYPYLSSIDTSNFAQIYLAALHDDIASLITLPRFVLFFTANIIFIYFCKSLYSRLILFAALANIVIKIILFPNFDAGFGERFFFTSYFLILFAVLKDNSLSFSIGTEKQIGT